MPELKLKQLHHESDTWKRLLHFITEETIHLKNRLSEILRDSTDIDLLHEMENFQIRFIKGDNLVGLLRHDVAEFDKLLVRENMENEKMKKKLLSQKKKIMKNIENADKQFRKVNHEFNACLTLKI